MKWKTDVDSINRVLYEAVPGGHRALNVLGC